MHGKFQMFQKPVNNKKSFFDEAPLFVHNILE